MEGDGIMTDFLPIVISIISICLTLVNIYYTHLKKLILDISVKAMAYNENFTAHLPLNINDDYKDYYGGFNLKLLLNIRVINQNLIFKEINVRAILNEKEYKCITHTTDIIKIKKYKILNFINYIEKNKSEDFLFQFFMENCEIKIEEIKELTLILEFNYKKNNSIFYKINLQDVNFKNLDFYFLE